MPLCTNLTYINLSVKTWFGFCAFVIVHVPHRSTRNRQSGKIVVCRPLYARLLFVPVVEAGGADVVIGWPCEARGQGEGDLLPQHLPAPLP